MAPASRASRGGPAIEPDDPVAAVMPRDATRRCSFRCEDAAEIP
jgi:hypothetical protein